MFLELEQDALKWAHPLIREWFMQKLGLPTQPQQEGWPSILSNKTTLISAPTGSGKTLAAFLIGIDYLVRKSLEGQLGDKTEVIYISPLKALSNDIHKNLAEPLIEIAALAKSKGLKLDEIRVAVRTGDTLPRERQAMLKKPPHILVTTPESFYILLTAEKSRIRLKDINTVIVDEIHAVANDKRGAHLSLSLERLEALCERPLLRIGLSATQKPLEVMAQFLSGVNRPKPVIVNIGHLKHLELAVEVPLSELGSITSHGIWDEIYDKIALLAQENRSTLVFVNTRKLAERVAHHLEKRLGEAQVAAHHGSLSRKLRLAAETKLKQGELKLLVATASLELGIDIGSIDLVCQIGSPRAMSIALQRVGRAGHWYGAISKGKFFATTRDELLECAALVHSIKQGKLDQLVIPEEPLDILAQQIVAMCASDEWLEDNLFDLITHSYFYARLSRDTFNSVIEMLAEGVAGSRGRYGAYLFRDRLNGVVKARRGSRLVAITSGGAIPENGLFTVVAEPQGIMVGTLDEDFAVESNRGDIFLLGTTSWRVKRVESAVGRVLVEDAHGAPPSVPFWRGEAPARTVEFSLAVSDLRKELNDLLPFCGQTLNEKLKKQANHAIQWLKGNCCLDTSGAEQLIEYILQGRTVLGAVPTQERIIAERFFDEGGGMQLVIHAPFGARINKAWGLALRKSFCRSFNFELQAAATDDGLNISLAEQHSFPLSDVFRFLHPNTILDVLRSAILQSPLFNTRWRWNATRSLALVRFRQGKKVPPYILRILSEDLLAAIFPDAAACQDNLKGRDIELPDHPLIKETMKEILTQALDSKGLTLVLDNIRQGKIECLAVDTPLPSVFSHEILNANPYAFLDDAPLEERRARAVEMRRLIPDCLLQEVGKLDPLAISEVQHQAWPDIRNADELQDTLHTVIAMPMTGSLGQIESSLKKWQPFMDQLVSAGRGAIISFDQYIFWFAVEKINYINAIYPGTIELQSMHIVDSKKLTKEEALLSLVRGWMLHLGPVTSGELSKALGIAIEDIDFILLKLEASGFILRGHFRNSLIDAIEWCERRLLARIHRLTLGILRKEIQPVTAAQFINWLLRWQHLAPGTQLKGEQGLMEAIRQLQGFEIPANAWEQQILAKRVADYHPGLLDRLCLSGMVGWGRLSSHPITQFADKRRRRIKPTSVAPITFFIREESNWLPASPHFEKEEELIGLGHVAKSTYLFLKQRGASFFNDIVHGIGHLKAEVEAGLWELVAAGFITADGFDNLRGLIDPKRRLNRRYRHHFLPLTSGRWSLLYHDKKVDVSKQVEAVCWMLLKRYGVIFRDLLTREKNIPTWRELLVSLRRLEDRGEIRGGRFVSGFLGEQFALPIAVDSLRAMRKQAPESHSMMIVAVDPLNLVGIILPGERIPALSNKKVALPAVQE